MLEALIASTVLIIGLTGITMMLLRGATNSRNGQQAHESSQVIAQVLSDISSNGFDNTVLSVTSASFDAGNADDGGVYTDASGRRYAVRTIVSDITVPVPPAQVLIPTRAIAVEVSYRDGNGIMVYKRGNTIMSRSPDAGP